MNLTQTLNAFDEALNEFFEKDCDLLHRDISERSITHKIAEYLGKRFTDFHTDCEYNGDMYNRKELGIDKYEMIALAVRKIDKDDTYAIFPDIIIHKRKSNKNNHLVIEVKKKNGNNKEKQFDIVKLKKLTTQYKYRLGIYLELKTGENCQVSEIKYFQTGNELNRNNLAEL
jgi:hypothetical protein